MQTHPNLHNLLKVWKQLFYEKELMFISRPFVEEQRPDLLQITQEIGKVGDASDDRQRSETIRPCLTLDDLRENIEQSGYDIKRTTTYYRLLPPRASSIQDH